MRLPACLVAVLAVLAPAMAGAQGLPAVNAPGRGQTAQPMPAPTPAPPGQAQLLPGQVLPAVPPPPGAAATPPPAAPSAAPVAPVEAEWLAMTSFELRAIDKVMARNSRLTGRVGDTIAFGALTIQVRRCIVRPPEVAPDAAAFLEIAEAGKPPVFRGWMVRSAPQLALLEHPSIDIHLAGCRS